MSRQGHAEFFIVVGSLSALCVALGLLGLFCWLGVSLLMSGLWMLGFGFTAASFWAYMISGQGLTFQKWVKNFSFTFAIIGSFVCSAFVLFWTQAAAGWWALAFSLSCVWHLAHLQHLKGKVWVWISCVSIHSLLLYFAPDWAGYFLLGLSLLFWLLGIAIEENFQIYMLFSQERQAQHWFHRHLNPAQWRQFFQKSPMIQSGYFIELYLSEYVLNDSHPKPASKKKPAAAQEDAEIFWELVSNEQVIIPPKELPNQPKMIALATRTEFIGLWLQKSAYLPHLKTNLEEYAQHCSQILSDYIQQPHSKLIAQKLKSAADLEDKIDAFYPQIPADFANLQLLYGLFYPAIGIAKNEINS